MRRFLLRLLASFRGRRDEAELEREIASHLQLLEDRFVAEGMSPEEARFAARRAFGGVALAKERQRETRTFAWLASSRLDFKLGLRMLAKHPGLTLVSVAGMGVAIAIASGYYGVVGAFLDSPLPLPEGDRVVAIRYGDGDVSGADFRQWRDQVTTIEELGAFSEASRNLLMPGRPAELLSVAAMTASGFRVARVAPLLGRPLLDDDERSGTAPVVVLGYDEWQRRFDGDPRIVGQTLRLDATLHTVVGVMPPGFAFPIRHRVWIPLQLTDGAAVKVFGRLTAGSSLADARAELTAIGARMADVPVRPQVLSYPRAVIGIEGPEMELAFRAFQIGIALLLVIIAANVAILVYARTATRTNELAVRTALGASRGRIVAQLFIEALVLSLLAAGFAMLLLRIALDVGHAYHATSTDPDDQLPFWIQLDFSAGVFIHAAILAVVAAVIVGVLPALKATGKRVQRGMQLGRTWTALVVLQVALAVAVLPSAVNLAQHALRAGMRQPAPAALSMLRARLATSGDAARSLPALLQRLREEPEIAAVTYADSFPGRERYVTVETDTDAFPAGANRVAENLFTVFDAPLLAGRGFALGDERPGATAVIVDQAFAEHLGGGDVIGRRVRYSPSEGPFEIVGVVPTFARVYTAANDFGPSLPRIFHAAAPGAATLVVRLATAAPAAFAPKLIDLTAGVDPRLKLERLEPVAQAWRHDQQAFELVGLIIAVVVASVVLLSAAGIYAMMSFIVASRRREIGIRAAMGADARRILLGIFGRAALQLGAGVLAGMLIATLLDWAGGGDLLGGSGLIVLPAVAALMFTVGALAALGPARRSLAVPPAEALRAE